MSSITETVRVFGPLPSDAHTFSWPSERGSYELDTAVSTRQLADNVLSQTDAIHEPGRYIIQGPDFLFTVKVDRRPEPTLYIPEA